MAAKKTVNTLDNRQGKAIGLGQQVNERVQAWTRLLDDIHIIYRAALLGSTTICDAFGYLRVPVPVQLEVLQRFALAGLASGRSTPANTPSGPTRADIPSDPTPGCASSSSTPSTSSTLTSEDIISSSTSAEESSRSGTRAGESSGAAATGKSGGRTAKVNAPNSISTNSKGQPAVAKPPPKSKKSEPDGLLTATQASFYLPRVDVVELPPRDGEPQEERNPPLPQGLNYLHLPVLISEWKREGGNILQAANQHYVNHTSGARFLEACGIVDFPVFGLTSNGPLLTLDYAYTGAHIQSKAFGERMERPVLIGERDAIQFDLQDPIGMWRLATTVISINRLHVPGLLQEWEQAQRKYHTKPTGETPPDHPSWLHGYDLFKEKKLPEWTVPYTALKTQIEDQLLPQLREEYQDEPQKLQALKKIEAMLKRGDGKKEYSVQTQKLVTAILEQQEGQGLVSSP